MRSSKKIHVAVRSTEGCVRKKINKKNRITRKASASLNVTLLPSLPTFTINNQKPRSKKIRKSDA